MRWMRCDLTQDFRLREGSVFIRRVVTAATFPPGKGEGMFIHMNSKLHTIGSFVGLLDRVSTWLDNALQWQWQDASAPGRRYLET